MNWRCNEISCSSIKHQGRVDTSNILENYAYRRRAILLGGFAVAGGGLIGYHEMTKCEEIACFSFEYHGADDAPNRLDVRHTGGQGHLRADDVYFSEVVTDWESRETDTLAWSELDDDREPSDPIDGDEIRLRIITDLVKILWRQGDDEQAIGAWVHDDDVDRRR